MLQRDILADAALDGPRVGLCRLARIDGWRHADLSAPYWRCYAALDAGGEIVIGREVRPLVPGESLLIAPSTPFATRNQRPFRKLYLHVSWALPGWEAVPGVHASPVPPGLVERLGRCADDPAIAGRDLARIGLAVLAASLAALPGQALVAAADHPPDVRRAMALLRADPARTPGNAALARAIGCHPGSLVRSFTASVGMPPQRFAMGLRLERAAERLASTDETVAAIASACGFCDRNHFTRAFTRRWRCPPATYRRRHQR